jgi:hypothetical protein
MRSLIYIILLVFVSCKVLTLQQEMPGEYYKGGKDCEYSLKLNQDSTFVLSIKYQDAKPQCNGKWQYLGKDTLVLKCNEVENISETLNNGYMTDREKKVRIINRNRLKLDQIILKRMK